MRAPSLATWALALLVAGCGPGEPPERPKKTADLRLAPDAERRDGTVPPGATFADILDEHEVAATSSAAFLEAVEPIFSSRQLRATHAYEVERAFDGSLREFVYRIDADRYLLVQPAGTDGAASPAERFAVEVAAYRKERGLVAIRGDIDRDHPSLVAALGEAGEDVSLAIALADLFSGDIDFNSDLQQGDSFEVLFEQVLREGARAGYGDILAARFTNDGQTYTAFRYETPGGKPAYYDAQGRSLRRFFLASPLKFEPRVTSGFSYRRLHPVLGIRRPHLGADFGAPRGAPVVAISDGTVVSAGRMGGGGNTVVLRHASGYESRYLHLSSFGAGIRAGVRVQQGQLIGRVGSTGLATGPHLHYELKKNGRHVNPVAEHKRHPPGDPVPAVHRAAFEAAREELSGRFVSAAAN
jgi:murein DD-endopeptidase MepM/ murein hydrolase activator NlpD